MLSLWRREPVESPDHLPEKQELYQLGLSASRCPELSIRTCR